MLNIYLLRHGESEYNADGNRYCGRTDAGLTEKGKRQAELVAEQLQHISFDRVYSSPLTRARLTAEIAVNSTDIVNDERLVEIDFGKWEGKTREQFTTEYPDNWKNWIENPVFTRAGETGETAAEVVKRVNDFYQSLQKEHPAGNILIVAHNGINRLYLAYKLGMNLKDYRRIIQENSSVTLFELDENGEMSLKLLNSKCL